MFITLFKKFKNILKPSRGNNTEVRKVSLWCSERNGEGEIIGHFAPICSVMLEDGDPRREHGHPQN